MWSWRDPFGFGNTGYARAALGFAPLPADLSGLHVAITGANSGLGLAATRGLAARGATVWMLVRNKDRGDRARESVSGDARVVVLDVSDFDAIANLDLPRPDVLIHNAGMLASVREDVRTPRGPLERTVATHVAGPWLLSHRLQPANTVWVSSGGMYPMRLHTAATFDPPSPFDGVAAYARCKRAQVVIAARLGHHAMHPGWADSPGVAESLPRFYRWTRPILRTPEQGADTLVWLAATRPQSPAFWFDRAPTDPYVLRGTRHPAEEEGQLVEALRHWTGVG